MNICCFTGRTTGEIEVRYTPGTENAYAVFTIAVDDGYGEAKHTSFLNMSAFGKTAESLGKHVNKGTKIAVTSRARQNKFKDKDGNDRYSISFIVNQWEFAQSKQESAPAAEAATGSSLDEFMSIDPNLEDLPFN